MIKGEVTARPQVFAAAVKWAAKFLDARPSVPVQGGLLLEITDGTMTVTSMNENLSAVASLSVEGIGEGRAVVSGRLLNELVSTFPDKPVAIAGDGATASLTLAAGRWKGTLPLMVGDEGKDEFPAVPDLPEAIGTVAGDEFARVVAEVAAATEAKDPDKQVQWRSLHLTFGRGIAVIGTDSYRAAGSLAASFSGAGAESDFPTALVLAAPMVDVAAGFIGPDVIQLGLSTSQISLASATRSVVMRQTEVIGGTYPVELVEGLLATEQPLHAVVTTASLLKPLKRAELMKAKDGPIAVGFADGTITLAAKAEDLEQDGAEEIDAEYAGPEVVLHFNPRYFADALGSAPGEKVDMALTDKTGPGGRPGKVVLTVDGMPWRHVLMPIKVR